MSDLISRSALLEKIQFRIPNDRVLTDIVDSCVKITRRIIEEAPAVDAVPVVRCKDCKQWDKETGWCNQHSSFIDDRGVFCTPWESSNWKLFDENDFCSYGERKDNG